MEEELFIIMLLHCMCMDHRSHIIQHIMEVQFTHIQDQQQCTHHIHLQVTQHLTAHHTTTCDKNM